MKKWLLLLILFFAYSKIYSFEDINSLRKCFHESVIDEAKVSLFHEKVMNISMPTAIQKAYQAASYALLAKKIWDPFEKINHINHYGKLIDQAIVLEPDNIEIRFLRLSIDYYIPMIMGRKKNISNDKILILKLLTTLNKLEVNHSFNRFIFYFLKSENIYSEEELAVISSKLN